MVSPQVFVRQDAVNNSQCPYRTQSPESSQDHTMFVALTDEPPRVKAQEVVIPTLFLWIQLRVSDYFPVSRNASQDK